MSENTPNTRSHISPRPTTGEKTYKFNSSENKDSLSKVYFSQLDSKGLRDPFAKHYRVSDSGVNIIRPPINPNSQVRIIQNNAYLTQCIDAMVTNIHGFGYRLEFNGKEDTETSKEAITEAQWLEELFDAPNTYMPFQELRERLAWDYYVFGNAYLEVTRDNKGRIATMHHLPATTMRITQVDPTKVPVNETLMRAGKEVTIPSNKTFRKYVQLDDLNHKVWFKEFGDPRLVDPATGKENTSLAAANSATEVIHIAKYNGQSVYGIPSWQAQMPSIIGSREAELTNLDFFENNAVPALALLVSGGYLTEEAFDALKNNFESVKGRGSTNKVLIIEARGAVEDSSATGAVPVPTVQLKPLYAERQNDALFQEYEKNAAGKIRSVFRLPNVFVGSGDEQTTYASAKVSLEVAENQIFVPERVKFDDIINKKILSTWKPKYWRFRSNPAALVTSDDLLKAIETFNDVGAMTPNVAIGILNEKLNLDIPRVDQFWGDLPTKLLEDIMRAQAGPDKSNFLVDALNILDAKTMEDVNKVDVTPSPTVSNRINTNTNTNITKEA